MSSVSLQALIGTALTDTTFRRALLNGSRRKMLDTFSLTHDEIDRIMRIQADSLEQFAYALHEQFFAGADDLEPLSKFSGRASSRAHKEWRDAF